MMGKSIDDELVELVRSLNAEKATVSMTFDKDTWWTRRGKGTERHFTIEIEWGDDKNESRRMVGIASSFSGALAQLRADVAAHLVKGSLDA